MEKETEKVERNPQEGVGSSGLQVVKDNTRERFKNIKGRETHFGVTLESDNKTDGNQVTDQRDEGNTSENDEFVYRIRFKGIFQEVYEQNWKVTIFVCKHSKCLMYEHRLVDDMVAYASKVMVDMSGHARTMMEMFRAIYLNKVMLESDVVSLYG
ncbi:hypothetical protein Tco_0595788 [Tanacetum coccineum]